MQQTKRLLDDSPEEELREQRGRRWGLPQGCSDSRPPQAEIRIVGEVVTILAEAALWNEQVDKAMETMGVAQNLKKEEKVVVARGEWSRSVQMGLAQAGRQGILAGISKTRQGIFAGTSKTKVSGLGGRLTWNMIFAAGKEIRTNAAWNAWHMTVMFWKAKVQMQRLQRNSAVRASLRACAFAGINGSFTEGELSQLEACQNKLARCLLAVTRRNWDTEPKKTHISTKEMHQSLEKCQSQRSSGFVAWDGPKKWHSRLKKTTKPTNKCWQQFSGKRVWTSTQV